MKLKLRDGTKRELAKVRHVLNLLRSLISLVILYQIGCMFKVESDTLWIIKWPIVLMKGHRNNELYVFKGKTIICIISIIVRRYIYKFLLWYLRLAHMSERRLKELSKQGLLGEKK